MSFLSCMLLEVIYYGLGFLWILILNDFAKKYPIDTCIETLVLRAFLGFIHGYIRH